MAVADMTVVQGTAGNDDIRATSDADGTYLAAGAGDDILRGGRYEDILIGGAGDDQMFGGSGDDQFRFYGYSIDGASDKDFIRDLTFEDADNNGVGDGDLLVFNSFAAGTFMDAAGLNSIGDGSAAIISTWEGIANAQKLANVYVFDTAVGNENLTVRVVNGDQYQDIVITNGQTHYTGLYDVMV